MKLPILLLTCALAFGGVASAVGETDYLTYENFITQVEAGTVKSVELNRFSSIKGTYTVSGSDRPFHSYGGSGTSNDVLLIRLLNEKHVSISFAGDKSEMPFLGAIGVISSLIMLVPPVLTLILLFLINSRVKRLEQRMDYLTTPRPAVPS